MRGTLEAPIASFINSGAPVVSHGRPPTIGKYRKLDKRLYAGSLIIIL